MKQWCLLVSVILMLQLGGCATRPEPVPALLLADEWGMLSPVVSQQVSNQALSGINSAIHIRGHAALARSRLDSAAESGLIVSTVVVDDEQRAELSSVNALALQQTAFSGGELPPDLMLYTLISWLPIDDDQALLEVVTAMAEEATFAARAAEPDLRALVDATVWFAVSRKMVRRSEVESYGQPDGEALMPVVVELSGKAISLLPK